MNRSEKRCSFSGLIKLVVLKALKESCFLIWWPAVFRSRNEQTTCTVVEYFSQFFCKDLKLAYFCDLNWISIAKVSNVKSLITWELCVSSLHDVCSCDRCEVWAAWHHFWLLISSAFWLQLQINVKSEQIVRGLMRLFWWNNSLF